MAVELYVPSAEADALLLQWWARMGEAGEIAIAFPAFAAPSTFLATMQPPNALFIERDAQGIAVASWFSPTLNGAMLNLWAREDWRQRRWFSSTIEALGHAFDYVPVVVFVTQSPHVIAAARDAGFEVPVTIPHLVPGGDATLGYLTRERYKERHGNGIRR